MKKFYKDLVFNEIKNILEKFTSKSLYQCPCCEKIIEWDNANYNPEDKTYTCNECRTIFDETELQEITLLDYIENLFLNYIGDKEND